MISKQPFVRLNRIVNTLATNIPAIPGITAPIFSVAYYIEVFIEVAGTGLLKVWNLNTANPVFCENAPCNVAGTIYKFGPYLYGFALVPGGPFRVEFTVADVTALVKIVGYLDGHKAA